MTPLPTQKDDQNLWNLIFTVFFVVIVLASIKLLYALDRPIALPMPVFDFILIALATMRLTRLFVYDAVTRFFRDFFVIRTEEKMPDGTAMIIRREYKGGPLRTLSHLLGCPWCTAMWFAFFVTFCYYLTPLAYYVIVFLAIAALASIVQITANMIGWKAELLKKKAHGELL